MNWIWGKVGKVLGGLLLFSGGTVSLALLVGIFASHASGVGLAILASLLVFFGLSPALLGGFLLYSAVKAQRQALREQFFYLLQVNQGRLCVLDFAIAARLEPAIARQHLDGWAKEFSAEFEVTERGDIYYIFTPDPLLLAGGNTMPMFSQAVRQWLQSNF